MKPKKLEYRGTDKVKLYLQKCVNWLLDNSGKTEVNVEPSLLSGVKVADITVDEETKSIYAPNPPTVKNNISEMNDVELTDLSDGQILKYDDTEEKWVNANETGGTEVEANPQGTPTDTLNSIGIDGVIYGIEGGSPTPSESVRYIVATSSTGTYDAALTINKYINDVLDTTETIVYTDIIGTWKDYNYFQVGYNVITASSWSVKVVHDIKEYANEYTDTWHYTTTNNIILTVDSGDAALSDLSDVDLSNLSNRQILQYNSTTEKWENADNQSSLPFDIVIDPNDNGINLIYSQSISGITKVYDSTDSGISSYTVEESGIYMVINTYSANSTHEITVPQSARIINSGNLGSDRGVSWIIAELQDNDEVTINTVPSNWVAFSKVVYRIDGISIESLVDTSYQSDGTATYTPPQDNNHYLMVGVSMGRTANLYRNDTNTSSSSCDIMIEQDIGVNTTIGIYYGIGNQLPQANFYGYDGGCSCIFNYLTGGD